MKVNSVSITRNFSYESQPGELKGMVGFEGTLGSFEVRLSPIAMTRMLAVIEAELLRSAETLVEELPAGLTATVLELDQMATLTKPLEAPKPARFPDDIPF